MKKIDLLVSAKWVLPIAPKNEVLDDHAVAINGGRIIDVLPREWAETKYDAEQTKHFGDHVLMPGLVNAHAHTPMNLFRGLADDLKLMDWLQNHIWPAEGELINESSVRIGSKLAIAEMLRTGTTCFADHYMFPQATAEVVKTTGIRACLGLQMMDVPTKWAANGREALDKGLAIYKSFEKHPRITWAWAPHAPYTTSDDTFERMVDINKDLGLPIHIHLHETQQEVNDSIDEYRTRPIERLHDLGVLSPKFVGVHMTQVNNSDLELMQATGMHVVHCPESNLKLASGFAPITDILEADINVALGTDGAASNNDLNMFGELQTAALIAKAQSESPLAIPAAQALEMATINGAKAFGLDKEIGSLEVGKAADMIAIDLSAYFTQPIYHPISHLAYAMNALQVSDVWVEGKQLLKKGKLTELDVEDLLHQTKLLQNQAIKFGN
ncbi:MAG: TRZ/ATZ family hydrolase [Coxiellaceae bacterium]|nr:TRZ/ATZ family hydrolase [Coxiellaceae bacterium]